MSQREHGCRSVDPPRSAALLVDAGTDPSGLSALGARLADALPERWRVFTGVLEGGPTIADAVERALAEGCRELVVVPARPQFSPLVTGPVLGAVYRVLLEQDAALDVAVHATWHDDAGYVSALARWVAEYASAHGLRPALTNLTFAGGHPEEVATTDASRREARRTAELVAERVGWPSARVRVAAGDDTRGDDQTLVCPLSPLGKTGGGGARGRAHAPPLLDFPPLIAALKSVVLKGPRPVPRGRRPPAPLLPPVSRGRSPGRPATLVSIGASLAGGLGRGRGPDLRFSDPGAFARVKQSHAGLRGFLDWVRDATPLQEALVWNTCQRVEFYGWLSGEEDTSDATRLVARIRRRIFGVEPAGLEVNILDAYDARHHVLRTACGLNSDLPGDRDVVAQLQTACRRAQSAGTAGVLSLQLVSDAVALAGEVVTRTPFGRFATGYCSAALSRIREAGSRNLSVQRHVVIGGSTTSRSLLCALRSEYGVPEHQLTSVYRDHHGQMKQLRAAVGNGRRLRVHTYGEACVLQAVADADLVFFGIDQAEPVIDAGALEGLRDYAARPLTVVDFNTCGSLAATPADPDISLWTARDLDNEVAVHAAITTTREGFSDAVLEAEEWIERHLVASDLHPVRGGAGSPAVV